MKEIESKLVRLPKITEADDFSIFTKWYKKNFVEDYNVINYAKAEAGRDLLRDFPIEMFRKSFVNKVYTIFDLDPEKLLDNDYKYSEKFLDEKYSFSATIYPKPRPSYEDILSKTKEYLKNLRDENQKIVNNRRKKIQDIRNVNGESHIFINSLIGKIEDIKIEKSTSSNYNTTKITDLKKDKKAHLDDKIKRFIVDFNKEYYIHNDNTFSDFFSAMSLRSLINSYLKKSDERFTGYHEIPSEGLEDKIEIPYTLKNGSLAIFTYSPSGAPPYEKIYSGFMQGKKDNIILKTTGDLIIIDDLAFMGAPYESDGRSKVIVNTETWGKDKYDFKTRKGTVVINRPGGIKESIIREYGVYSVDGKTYVKINDILSNMDRVMLDLASLPKKTKLSLKVYDLC